MIRVEATRLATLVPAPWQPRLHSISAAGSAQPLAPRYSASSERTVFRFSPGRFDAGTVTYRTRLLGHNANWSAPAAHPEISFTNLEGGPFTLEVIATDAAGRDSDPLRFTFSVSPPLHRTAGAYVLYVLAALATVADAGAAALALLTGGQEPWPDLAILDLRMEAMDGLELTRRLRTDPRGPALRILLTSASVISFDPAEARTAGCDDFLPKPFRTSDLVEKIGALLALTWHEAPADICHVLSDKPPVPQPLPEPARAALRDVLAQGDLEAFRATLAHIRTEHPHSAARWTELDETAAAYQLSRLRSLLDQP